MAENSKIEWTRHTVNPWWGCTEVHAGCDNCYARVLSERWGNDLWGTDKPRMETKNWLNDLAKYQKKAAAAGEVHRVFIGSMMDIFEKPMPVVSWHGDPSTNSNYNTGDIRALLFNMISSGHFPNLQFLFLTKRPSNINKYIPESWKEDCPTNVMFGTSVVNQETADKFIPQMLEAPGRKFLSMEPLIGPVYLTQSIRIYNHKVHGSYQSTFFGDKIHWVIVGGESGHHARPLSQVWAVEILNECITAGIPFFFKQGSQAWGSDFKKFESFHAALQVRQFPVIKP